MSEPTASARSASEMIQHSPLGKELTQTQCRTLATITVTRALNPGELLFKEGERDGTLHIIVTGSLKAVHTTAAGEVVDLYDLYPGEMAGIMSFMDDLAHGADMQALENCTILGLPREPFEALLDQDPELVYNVMRAVIRTVLGILQRMDVQCVELTNYVSKQHGRY